MLQQLEPMAYDPKYAEDRSKENKTSEYGKRKVPYHRNRTSGHGEAAERLQGNNVFIEKTMSEGEARKSHGVHN